MVSCQQNAHYALETHMLVVSILPGKFRPEDYFSCYIPRSKKVLGEILVYANQKINLRRGDCKQANEQVKSPLTDTRRTLH